MEVKARKWNHLTLISLNLVNCQIFLSMQWICSPNVPFSTNDCTCTFLLDLIFISAFKNVFSTQLLAKATSKRLQQQTSNNFNDPLLKWCCCCSRPQVNTSSYLRDYKGTGNRCFVFSVSDFIWLHCCWREYTVSSKGVIRNRRKTNGKVVIPKTTANKWWWGRSQSQLALKIVFQ